MTHRFSAFGLIALPVLLVIFANFAQWNYRSPDGFLGRTVPPWQAEILSGAAPAPYVYRQAVPQLRRALESILQPGHAAVVIDTGFAAVAVLCGLALAERAQGRAQRWAGAWVAIIACAAVYPNDKPESVASVALVLLAGTLALKERHGLAAVVCTLSAPFRPELPILFGGAFVLTSIVSRDRRAVLGPPALIGYASSVGAGAMYLAMAWWVWWPDAAYPVGTPVLMLVENLKDPLRYPGLALGAAAVLAGSFWWLAPPAWPVGVGEAGAGRTTQRGLSAFVVLWVAAFVTVGRADEIRVLMPLLPLCAVLSLQVERGTPARV